MSMSTEVATKKATARQDSARQLKEAEWKKSFLRDCDTKSTESTNARAIQGAGEIPSAPKPAKPKKPREKKPVDSTPKKNAQRAKGSIALNKTIEQTDAEPKPEKRTLGESIDKLSKYEAGSQICKNVTEEPKTPVSGQRRRKKASREVGDKAEKAEKKPAKPKASVVKEPSCESVDEETIEVVTQEPVEVKSDEIRAVTTGFNSCSFFEKIQQGVKAYFSSRSSFNPEDAKKKEGGVRHIWRRVQTVFPGLERTLKAGKKLFHVAPPEKVPELPPTTYRSTVGLRNFECASSASRRKTKADDSKSQISKLAPASFKATCLPNEKELNSSDSPESEVKLVDPVMSQNSEHQLYGFGDEDSASYEKQRESPGIGRDVGEDPLEEIDNIRQGGERQISAISENFDKTDSQETNYELFGDGDESESGFPSAEIKTAYWNSLVDSLQSSLRRDQFVYNLEVLQQPELPTFWETPLHYVAEEPLATDEEILSSSIRCPSDTFKTDVKVDETSTLMGGVDLHLELQNYIKAIESSQTTKSRTKNTLQCNYYDNYIPLQIYSSSQNLQGRVEEYYDVPQNESGSSFNSATSDCKELEEVANEMFLDVTADQHSEFRNARSENQKHQKTWRPPRERLSREVTLDGYEKIYPVGNSRKCRSVLFQDSPASILPSAQGLQWSPTLQELIDIYNSVLKQNKKIQRNSLLGNCTSSHLFPYLKEKIEEIHYKNGLMQLSNELKNSHWKDQKKLGKPERGPPDSVTLEEYVSMFQEILQSSLSIEQITRLNDLISGLQTYSEKNYNIVRDQDMKNRTKRSGPKPQEKPEAVPAPQTPKKPKKVNFEIQKKTSERKSKKPLKSKVKSKSKSVKGVPKGTERTQMSEAETEVSSQTRAESVLKTLFGVGARAKIPEPDETTNKLLVNVQLHGSQVLVNDCSFFKNEDTLSPQKQEENGTSELIIENVTQNEMPFDLWWKNTKSSRLRIMGKNSHEENEKRGTRKPTKVTSAAKRRQETRPKMQKVETRKPNKKIENFVYSQTLLRAQHPIDAIAEVSESKVSQLGETNHQRVEPPPETKILLEDIPASPMALREALKAALEKKVFSKDLICDLICSEEQLGKAFKRQRVGPFKGRLAKRHQTSTTKNQAATVRSMVDLKKPPARKPKGSKVSSNQSLRNNFLCYSTKIEKPGAKKPSGHGTSPALSGTKQTRSQDKREASKKISKEVALKWKRSDSTTTKTSSFVDEPTAKERPSTAGTITTPIEKLTAKEKPRTESIFIETLSEKKNPSIEMLPRNKEELSMEAITNSDLPEGDKLWADDCDSSNTIELLFSEGKAPDKAAEDPTPKDDQPEDPEESFVSIQDKTDSPKDSETMGSWLALLPPAGCIDCVSLLTEMIHSDSFLVNFPHHGVSQTMMKPLLKCNSDMKFYPGCVTEGTNEEKPLLTFVLTPSQQERAKLPQNQVTVIRKEAVQSLPGAVTKNEDTPDDERQKSLKSIEEFIQFLSKTRKLACQIKPPRKPQMKIQSRRVVVVPQKRPMAATNRLLRSSITGSRLVFRECQKQRLAKMDEQLSKKKSLGTANLPTKKKANQKLTDPVLDKMVKNLSRALKALTQKKRSKNETKKEEIDKDATKTDSDIFPKVVEAIKMVISTTEGLPHKEELISAIGSGVFRTKNRRTGGDKPAKKTTEVKIKIQCHEQKRNQVPEAKTIEEKPKEVGQPEPATGAKTEIALLDSLVNRGSWSGDLKRINSTYFDACEKAGGVQMSGDSTRTPSSVEETMNLCAEFGVNEENKLKFDPSDELLLSKDVLGQESEEIMYEKISKSLEQGEVAYSMALLEVFLKKSEHSDSTRLKKMLTMVQNKSKSIMLSMERKAWLKVLSSLDEIFLAFESEGVENHLRGQLETTKQFIDKIQVLNTKRLDALQNFCSSCMTSPQEEDDRSENVFNKLKRSLILMKQKFTLRLNSLTRLSDPPSETDQNAGMSDYASVSSSGIKIHATPSLSNIREERRKRKMPDDPQDLKKKLEDQYSYLRELTAEEGEFVPPEIQDVKEKVAEKLQLLEKVFECPSGGESSNTAANYWDKATSLLKLARKYRKAEKDGEKVKLDRSPGYVDLMRCLIKAWDTRTTMGSIANECFL